MTINQIYDDDYVNQWDFLGVIELLKSLAFVGLIQSVGHHTFRITPEGYLSMRIDDYLDMDNALEKLSAFYDCPVTYYTIEFTKFVVTKAVLDTLEGQKTHLN